VESTVHGWANSGPAEYLSPAHGSWAESSPTQQWWAVGVSKKTEKPIKPRKLRKK